MAAFHGTETGYVGWGMGELLELLAVQIPALAPPKVDKIAGQGRQGSVKRHNQHSRIAPASALPHYELAGEQQLQER